MSRHTYYLATPDELLRDTPYAIVRYVDGEPAWIVSTFFNAKDAEERLDELVDADFMHRDWRIVRVKGVPE